MRKPLSKTIRFEVFKRDSFACQYCGRKAPDVLLDIDHIEPVAKGGTNDLLNLIAACRDCNSGKSDKRLSQTTVLDKQRVQLAELQERREQIDMMFQWQKGLRELQSEVVSRLHVIWTEYVPGYTLNENGLRGLKKLAGTYTVDEIVEAIRIAAEQYLDFQDGTPTKDSVEFAWKKLSGICRVRKLEEENPEAKRLYYIRGIVRNRFSYCNDGLAMGLLRKAYELNAGISSLEDFAKSAKSWTAWRDGMNNYIDEHGSSDSDASDSEDGI